MSTAEIRFRKEIQGLRAIAVLSVFVYHVFPSWLPGGYVGVDVFFVISGYLITGLLVREHSQTGTISLVGFYQRRIRRLMPAATLTLLGTALATSLLPLASWSNSGKGLIASTLYVQNWWLASRATDYLAQEEAAGPLQHFWSLSVEEQYYVVWPLLFLLLLLLSRHIGKRIGLAIGAPLAALGLASLAYSVSLSHSNPALGYLTTGTRIWELALGSGLAFMPFAGRLSAPLSRVLSLLGLALIMAGCFLFDHQTRFPGYAALMPTLGTAMILVGGPVSSRWSVENVLRNRVLQYYGDISYSLYLWHWPVIVYYEQIRSRAHTLIDALIIFLVAGALAHLSKRLVEDRFRRPGSLSRKTWHSFAFATVCMGATLGAGLWVLHALEVRVRAAESLPWSTMSSEQRAAAAVRARSDKSASYKKRCITNTTSTESTPCNYGDSSSEFHVALIGDSHAIHWEPAIIPLANQRAWSLSVYAKSACTMSDQFVTIGKPRVHYKSCDLYRTKLLTLLESTRPDVVIIALSRGYRVPGMELKESKPLLTEGLVRTVKRLESVGILVVLLADTPRLGKNIPECLSAPNYNPGDCELSLEHVLKRQDPTLLAGEQEPSLRVMDMTRHLCSDGICRAIQNDMIVYRDSHHLTATFAASLTSEFAVELEKHLPLATGSRKR